MINTFYCNYYEGLQLALIQNLQHDIEQMRDDFGLESIFHKITIVSGSASIEERLSQALANHFGVVPGIEFISTFQWLQPYVGATMRPGAIGSSLDWQIWWALNNPEFITSLEKNVDHASAERLLSYLRAADDSKCVDFSLRLSSLFATYASFRIDWLLNWLDESGRAATNPEKDKILKAQPDYHWQRALWRFIAKHDKTKDISSIRDINDRIRNIRFEPSDRSKAYHFFVPFSLPPLLLPFLKAFAEKENAPDLWLYIMNPSSEYWFESLPVQLFDWSGKTETLSEQYLKSNAASTRAVIDRLYHFLNTEEGGILDQDYPAKSSPLSYDKAPNRLHKIESRELIGILETQTPQEMQLFGGAEVQGYFFKNKDDSYLHKFQNSILEVNSELLPDEPDAADTSLKVLKAPTFTRELEAIVDWLHDRFNQDPTLQPSDVLIAVPDIERLATSIEGVMGGLPEDLKLPWKIRGNSLIDADLTINAILGLGRLLNSNFSKDALLDWLELPVNQARWNLSLSDISVLGTWLETAGFHNGISKEHLAALDTPGEDYSLETVIERLSLGYFINESELRPYGDTLPIFGNEEKGFDTVGGNNGQILKTFFSISELMLQAWKRLNAAKKGATAQEWNEIVNNWLATFFNLPKAPQELVSFRTSLFRIIEGMKEGLPANTLVSFDVFWKVLETQLGQTTAHPSSSGAITFASVLEMRGVPFKAICLAGFDEESGFPGNSSFDEFNLMGVDGLRRKGDRDARNDNKARFLDLLLSARENLLISYSVGTEIGNEKNPSLVVQSFKSYFLCNARTKDNGESVAKDIWNTIEVNIPLNTFSKGNYQTTPSKPWLSPRKNTLASLRAALDAQYAEEEKPFIDTSLPEELFGKQVSGNRELPADMLIKFICNPDREVSRRLGLPSNVKRKSEERRFTWLADGSRLGTKRRTDQMTRSYEQGFDRQSITERNSLYPPFGLAGIREESVREELNSAESFVLNRNEKIRTLEKITMDIRVPLDPDISSETHIKLVSDRLEEPCRENDGTYCLISRSQTETDKLKGILKALIWKAADIGEVVLYYPSLDSSATLAFSPEEARILLGKFVRLFSFAIKHGIALWQKKQFSDPNPILWRAINAPGVEARSENLMKSLKKFQDASPKEDGTIMAGQEIQAVINSVELLLANLSTEITGQFQ